MASVENKVNVMEEKEASKAVHTEDVGDPAMYDQAETEPRMNLQTILAFMVCILCPQFDLRMQADLSVRRPLRLSTTLTS